MTLLAWFHHREESCSYKDVQVKKICSPVKTTCPPDQNVSETSDYEGKRHTEAQFLSGDKTQAAIYLKPSKLYSPSSIGRYFLTLFKYSRVVAQLSVVYTNLGKGLKTTKSTSKHIMKRDRELHIIN